MDTLILALRIGLVVILYLFIWQVALAIRSDLRASAQGNRRDLGVLNVLESPRQPTLVGVRFPLEPISTVGRASGLTVTLPDDAVSNEHARLVWRRGGWTLVDLDSRNGTYVNNMRRDMPVAVKAGDIIQIGDTRMQLVAPQK